MNTVQQEVLTALKSYNFRATEKEVKEIVWLIEMEDNSLEEAINNVFEDRYMDSDDIDFDY